MENTRNKTSLLTVGSIAYDSVRTPHAKSENVLGGSATYFSFSASFFSPVCLVAIVGEDFAEKDLALFKNHGIVTDYLERTPGKTFRWSGEYRQDMNVCDTLDTELNVLANFNPHLTANNCNPSYLFLANIDPDLQLQVLQQTHTRPNLVAADTMNLWIESKPEALRKVIKSVDTLFVNESEAHLIGETNHSIDASHRIRDMGVGTVILKQGEYGAMTLSSAPLFLAPAYPVTNVVDPTGAGDAFAGGVMGYLASRQSHTPAEIRQAVVIGSVMASFAVESFGPYRLAEVTTEEIRTRIQALETFVGWDNLTDNPIPLRGFHTNFGTSTIY